MYPSSNIPSLQDIQKQYRDAAERARGRNVAASFSAATNQMALGRAAELEALGRQRTEQDFRSAAAQRQGRGFSDGGDLYARDRRFQEAVAAGGQRYNQAASQRGIQQAQAEQARDARADAIDIQATGVGAQFAAMERKEQLQRELAHLQAAQRQLDRASAEKMAAARDATQRASIAAQSANAQAQIQVAQMRIKADIRRTQIANPQFSGGGLTASYSTGTGNFQDHLRSMGVMR